MPLAKLFTDHPTAVGETYLEHFGVASRYAGRLFAAGFCALMHAFFPFLFEKTASNAIKAMYANMTKRGATQPLVSQAPSQTAAVDWGWL